MFGLTIEREIEIIRKRLNEIKHFIINGKIYPEDIKSHFEMIESLESQVENIRNRSTR